MRKRSLQEKKALSYSKDRRNCYGENDKSSRKSIRQKKAKTNRAYRRNVTQLLVEEGVGISLVGAETLDSMVKNVRRREWKKYPDVPLGEHVELQLEKRRNTYGARSKRREVRRSA